MQVFEAEVVRTRGRVFHKQCLSCCRCGHGLTVQSLHCDQVTSIIYPCRGADCTPQAGEAYCRGCYLATHFTSANLYLAADKGRQLTHGDTACVRCHRAVFAAEKVAFCDTVSELYQFMWTIGRC